MASENIEAYNKRAQVFFDQLQADKKAFYIVGKGRTFKEQCVIVYEPGTYIGYTFTSVKEQLDFDAVKEMAQPLRLNSLMESVLAPVVSGEKSKGYKVYTQMKIAVMYEA